MSQAMIVGDEAALDEVVVRAILSEWSRSTKRMPHIKNWLAVVVETQADQSAVSVLPWGPGIECLRQIAQEVHPEAVAEVEDLSKTKDLGPTTVWWCKRAPGKFVIGRLRKAPIGRGGKA
jgi:hypothetical protein